MFLILAGHIARMSPARFVFCHVMWYRISQSGVFARPPLVASGTTPCIFERPLERAAQASQYESESPGQWYFTDWWVVAKKREVWRQVVQTAAWLSLASDLMLWSGGGESGARARSKTQVCVEVMQHAMLGSVKRILCNSCVAWGRTGLRRSETSVSSRRSASLRDTLLASLMVKDACSIAYRTLCAHGAIDIGCACPCCPRRAKYAA